MVAFLFCALTKDEFMQSSTSIQFQQVSENTILEIENTAAKARISLFGGHVLSFIPKHDNKDRLWLSPLTKLDTSEAIRGGVPVCWPWFSNQFPSDHLTSSELRLPSHGYARTRFWHLHSINCVSPELTEVTLTFEANDMPGFPHQAKLQYQITIGKELTLSVEIQNLDGHDFDFTGALHTYFSTDNVENAEVLGLTGDYKDKTQGFDRFETPAHYKITGEVDRVHLTDESRVTIREGQMNTFIEMLGHDSVVVWNPGSDLAKTMGNVSETGFPKFLCIEAAITSEKTVAAKSSHNLIQKIA